MSRYTCHRCRTEHGTDNMVAYCAACFHAEQEKSRAPGNDDLMESLLVADSPLGTDALKTLAAAYRSSQARIRELESMERQCIDARLEKEQSRVKELEAGMKNLFTPEEVDAICARRLEAELKKRKEGSI